MNKDKISASEVNRYLYCHYQWYYEKIYGHEYIKNLYKERNKALGLTDSSKSNFVKGLKFHNEYKISPSKYRTLKRILLLALVLLILLLCFYLEKY